LEEFGKLGVKTMKTHLKKMIGESTLTFEEFSTVLSRIKACLNLCPIAIASFSSYAGLFFDWSTGYYTHQNHQHLTKIRTKDGGYHKWLKHFGKDGLKNTCIRCNKERNGKSSMKI
jgi:hypothetical protein